MSLEAWRWADCAYSNHYVLAGPASLEIGNHADGSSQQGRVVAQMLRFESGHSAEIAFHDHCIVLVYVAYMYKLHSWMGMGMRCVQDETRV